MRIQILFHKTKAMRYTGHLDLHKAWERSLRRANLRLAYSQGFHPQPKINLACALPLGFTSECELVDITLENEIPVDHILQKLVPALPPGILVTEIAAVDPQSPSLQTQVQSAEYQITMLVETPGFQEATATLFSLTEIPRIRRGKPYDLRPLLEDYSVLPDSEEGQTCVQVRLSARDGATGRPEEFISALGYEPYDARYHRTRLIVKETQPV